MLDRHGINVALETAAAPVDFSQCIGKLRLCLSQDPRALWIIAFGKNVLRRRTKQRMQSVDSRRSGEVLATVQRNGKTGENGEAMQ